MNYFSLIARLGICVAVCVLASASMATDFNWPVDGTITQRCSSGHVAIDIGVPLYSPVCASRAGNFSPYDGDPTGWGRQARVDHLQLGFVSRYAHCTDYVGGARYVNRGEQVARSGSTGRSTGPHTHFDILKGGVPQWIIGVPADNKVARSGGPSDDWPDLYQCLVMGRIYDKWVENAGAYGFLGHAQTDETKTPNNLGRYNHFQGGSIYWSPSTDAHTIYGAIKDKWASMGWETSSLGFPTSDEYTPAGTNWRRNNFQGGARSITWRPDLGYCTVP